MSEEMTPEAREALWRCYRYLLSLPAERDPHTESEDADKLPGTAASSQTESTEEVELAHSLAQSSSTSTEEELNNG